MWTHHYRLLIFAFEMELSVAMTGRQGGLLPGTWSHIFAHSFLWFVICTYDLKMITVWNLIELLRKRNLDMIIILTWESLKKLKRRTSSNSNPLARSIVITRHLLNISSALCFVFSFITKITWCAPSSMSEVCRGFVFKIFGRFL
jgi:hypothetical protein